MSSQKAFFSLSFLILLSGSLRIQAQNMAVYGNGSLGQDRNYLSLGVKYYTTHNTLFSIEGGGGLLGIQTELASAGDSPNLSGQNGFQSSVASGNVIAADPNVPANSYLGSLTTRFTGTFIRGSYEWLFPSDKKNDGTPRGFRLGVELAYFSIIQHQDIQFRSYNTSDTYDYTGTAWCAALAPGLRMAYDLVLGKHLLLAPEIASPFYIPLGRHAKTNGPFGKETVEIRLGIGWIFHYAPSRNIYDLNKTN